MKAYKGKDVRICFPKCSLIFLLFTFMLIIRLWNIIIVQPEVKSTATSPPRAVNEPLVHHDICTFQPPISMDKNGMLDSIVWPETPPLSEPFSLNQTSDPAHSTFTIVPSKRRRVWRVGDQLEVMIKMHDFQGHPKKTGGDFLVARLHNAALGAGVAGQVVDHLNGSYSAVFSLLWKGSAHVEVTLVHPSEAITVLQMLTSKHPDRIYFESLFQSGSVSETTTCNLCLRLNNQPMCNYTDFHTGEQWFCYKPKKLNCSARISHSKGGFHNNLTNGKAKLFQKDVNLKVLIRASGSANITVLPSETGQAELRKSSVISGPSGYYYQGVWQALDGTRVHQFNTSSAITQCLRGKQVHLYGDSTIRQWFEHFTKTLPELKEFDLHSLKQNGPFMALDYANKIMVTYRCHGPPIRFVSVPVSQLRYIANELDGLVGGANTIVVLSIWSHFSTYPLEVYIHRLQNIRRAVLRLLNRAPGTLVIIRTANPKALTLYEALTNSDWYSLQRDKVLRAMFKRMKVRLVDAWEMSLAHHLPHSLHPQPPIIKNMINVLLSYICP